MNQSSGYIMMLSKRPFRLLVIAAIFFLFGALLDYNFVALETDPKQEMLPTETMRALLWGVLLLMMGVISLFFELVLAGRPYREHYNEQVNKRVQRETGQNVKSA